MKNFVSIAAPHSSLLKKEKKWYFDKECKLSFKQPKEALVDATTLYDPDPNIMFRVHTNSMVLELEQYCHKKAAMDYGLLRISAGS